MSLINLTRRAAVIVQRGRFCATPIVRGKSVDEKETSEEEKYAAKHDYELLLKWADQQGKKLEIKTEEVKKQVKQELETHNKKNVDDISKLKNEVEELKSMLAKALETKK